MAANGPQRNLVPVCGFGISCKHEGDLLGVLDQWVAVELTTIT